MHGWREGLSNIILVQVPEDIVELQTHMIFNLCINAHTKMAYQKQTLMDVWLPMPRVSSRGGEEEASPPK